MSNEETGNTPIPINQDSFNRFHPSRTGSLSSNDIKEIEWYVDNSSRHIGVLIEDVNDSDCGYAVLSYDLNTCMFEEIDSKICIMPKKEARDKLFSSMNAVSQKMETEITNDLFDPIVSQNRLHDNFKLISEWQGYYPARLLMNELYQDFSDPDGNFLEQFQTHGFDTRLFEFYVYAYLTQSGYAIDRNHNRPDFLASRNGDMVAIEVTTVQPSQSNSNAQYSLNINSKENYEKVTNNVLPIKLGSPLFSKLKEKYWEDDHCKELPLVIFIQNVQEEGSLSFSSSSLGQYLYGMRHSHRHEEEKLIIDSTGVEEHQVDSKIIPSNFFGQPDAENISAVAFTNSGTINKFNRLAFQSGIGRSNMYMSRYTLFCDHNPDACAPKREPYDVDNPPVSETWGQGLEIFHNPNAKHPLPSNFFVDAAQHYIKDGRFMSEVPEYHPIVSKTIIFLPTDQSEQESK